MAQTANTIAYYFATKLKQADRPIKRRLLLNLVFYSHSWYLALTSKQLVEETFIASKMGPLVKPNGPMLKEIDDPDILKFLDNFWSAFSTIPDEDLNKKIAEEAIIKDSPQLLELSHDSIKAFFQKKEELITNQAGEKKVRIKKTKTTKQTE